MSRILVLGLYSMFFGIGSPIYAQGAEIFFNEGAKLYTENNRRKAREVVEEGIKRFPDDPKLKSLRGKLKDQDKDQDQEQDKEQDKDHDKNQDKDQYKNQDKDQEKDQQDKQQHDQKDQQQNQQPNPEQLTPEEAAQILDAMKAREAESQKRRKLRLLGRRYTGNAW